MPTSLSALELQLQVVSRVDAALQCLRSEEPAGDLVLTDLRLPDGSGLDLIAAQLGWDRSVPVVVVTGAGDEHTVIAALRTGASDYVLKSGDYLRRLPATLSGAMHQFGRLRDQRMRCILVLHAEADERDASRNQHHLDQRAPHIRLHTAADSADVFYGHVHIRQGKTQVALRIAVGGPPGQNH